MELLSFEKAEDAEDDDVKENIVGLDDEKEAQVSEHCEKFGGNERCDNVRLMLVC